MAGKPNFSESDRTDKKMLFRAVIASTVGTTIEWYDFFLYGIVTGLVFAKAFFPNSDPLVGTLQAFTIYAVGFAARPVGAAIFGHYGDRIGRKAALVATLLLMGIATVLVGFVPTYSQIGIWGAVILTVLRFVQGIGVGGEWGGSVLLAMEWSKNHGNRGFIASWPQFGVPAGLFLANLAVIVFNNISGDKFLEWGWRVPFILSAILIIIGLWIRLGILETPVFAKLIAENKIEKAPVLEVIKRQPKSILLSALIRLAEQTPFYIFTAFVFSYGTTAPQSGQRSPAQRGSPVCGIPAFCYPLFRVHLGSHWTEKNLLAGGRADGRQRLYFLRVTRHPQPGLDHPRYRVRSHSALHRLRNPGFFDCRTVHASDAIQWILDGLPTRFADRRRPRPDCRRLPFFCLQNRLVDRHLYRHLRTDWICGDSVHDGVLAPGHLRRIRACPPEQVSASVSQVGSF